jgi:glycosyltransferase involved in cell wall biosynthesis
MLAELREQAGTDSRIRFLGPVRTDRIGELFGEADVFAFPSRIDAFGLVIPEAFAAGLAVVLSAAPGVVGDLAVPERNCLIVRDHTATAWAATLRRVVEDRDLRQSLGRAASHTVRRRWTLEHSADAFICGLNLGVASAAHRLAT